MPDHTQHPPYSLTAFLHSTDCSQHMPESTFALADSIEIDDFIEKIKRSEDDNSKNTDKKEA